MTRSPKTEGGQGGGRGHSGMCHWEHTEIIKAEAKKERRRQDRALIREYLRIKAEAQKERRRQEQGEALIREYLGAPDS